LWVDRDTFLEGTQKREELSMGNVGSVPSFVCGRHNLQLAGQRISARNPDDERNWCDFAFGCVWDVDLLTGIIYFLS
jgi:hypothetical protein